jgi:hypothetical protein
MLGRCTGTNRDGRPCSAQAWRDGLCRWHHPDLAAARAGWRAKGGERRSNASRARKALPKDLRDVLDTLLGALAAVEAGSLTPGQATAMASLAGAILRTHQLAELEPRLAALEARQGGRTA